MGEVTITNARVVLPEQVLERATVRIDVDGRIAEIEDGPVSSATEQAAVVDAAGAYLIPGVIDLHNDNLEFEVNPRANAALPVHFALSTMERRLAGAGVTTEFHAITFMERPEKQRSVSGASNKAAYIASLQDGPRRAVRHEILHRLDVRSPHALDAAFESLDAMQLRYASINDHTPGQGQYRDVAKLIELAHAEAERKNRDKTEAEWYIQRMEAARQDSEAIPSFYHRVDEASRRNRILLSTHDDDSIEKVDAQAAIGATVAEFPITMDAAQRSRDLGMTIVVGAPNVLRGRSQSGNLAAAELISAGLADAICADYHAPCLIPAAFKLATEGMVDLPAAIRMITDSPARALGLQGRGAIRAGYIADLALVTIDRDGMPQVASTWIQGQLSYHFPFVLPSFAMTTIQ